MALHVKDTADHSRVPFLRGILTRSLQEAGLSFDEAYDVSGKIQDSLKRKKVITTDRLTEVVVEHLRETGKKAVARRYQKKKSPVSRIEVVDTDDNRQPFSKAMLAHGMAICGMEEEDCHDVAADIERMLIRQRKRELRSDELTTIVGQYLQGKDLGEAARRYSLWNEFSHSNRPLILLIGGTNGSGKSTIAADVAHRLNIIRTQSTDMLREVMRQLVPKRLVPTIHQSSFKAWKVLPGTESGKHPSSVTELASGFYLQSAQVGVAVKGVVRRAEREGVSVILEGIHMHPELMSRLQSTDSAIVVPLVLAVLKKKRLKKQLRGRGHQVKSRRAKRYMKHFDEIWNLQSVLLSESNKYEVPIVQNLSHEDTIGQVMDTIVERLDEEFGDSLEEQAEDATEA